MVPRDDAVTSTNPRSNVVATNVIPNNSLVFASACNVVTSNSPWAVKSAVRTRILNVVASGTRAFPNAISRAVGETAAREAAIGSIVKLTSLHALASFSETALGPLFAWSAESAGYKAVAAGIQRKERKFAPETVR